MIKTILISIVVLYALYKVSGFFMRMILMALGKSIEKKIKAQQEEKQPYQYGKWAKTPKKSANQLGNDNDFVDYEEVK